MTDRRCRCFPACCRRLACQGRRLRPGLSSPEDRGRLGARRTLSGKEPVRFDSFRFQTFRRVIGSVRFGKIVFSVRRGSAYVFQTRRGSVRFGSFPCPVPAGPRIQRLGSARPVRFGFLLLPDFRVAALPCHPERRSGRVGERSRANGARVLSQATESGFA